MANNSLAIDLDLKLANHDNLTWGIMYVDLHMYMHYTDSYKLNYLCYVETSCYQVYAITAH